MPEVTRTGTRAAETAARKERMIAAALELAAEGGYDAVQMRDVAQRADVALGTLYRHHPSKDHLLVSALATLARGLQTQIARRPPDGPTAAERVGNVLRRATRAIERDRNTASAMLTALGAPDTQNMAPRVEVRDRLARIIAEAADGEDIPDLADIVKVLGYVWWAVQNQWVTHPDEVDMGDELARAADLLLALE